MPVSVRFSVQAETKINIDADKTVSQYIDSSTTGYFVGTETTIVEKTISYKGSKAVLVLGGEMVVALTNYGTSNDYGEGWLRVYVNGNKVIEKYGKATASNTTVTVDLSTTAQADIGDQPVTVKVTLQAAAYRESSGNSVNCDVTLKSGSALDVTIDDAKYYEEVSVT